MARSRLHELSEHGVSVWVDSLSREMLETGELARLIDEDAVVGVTSNPTIFETALSTGDCYDEQLRLLEGRIALVRDVGVDLERDEPIDSIGAFPDRSQEVACALDVLDREREEDLLGVVCAFQLGAELRVVPVSGRQRLLEDGRVRGNADYRVFVDEPLQLTRLEQLARQRVDPDTDAVLRQLVQSAARHMATLARRAPP